ncbi:MAG: DUF4595 domain-containing protein [Leadbetterella sp.]
MKNILYILSIGILAACDPAIDCKNTCEGKRIRNFENGIDYFKIEYDSENRPTKYIKALAEFASFDYQNSKITKVYNGKPSTYILDASGKVTSSNTPSDKITYTYTYDVNDQVVKTVENKNGSITTFNHTWIKGNLVKTTYDRPPGDISTTVVYEYDENTRNSIQNPYLELNLLGTVVNNNIQSEYLGLNLTGQSSGNAIKKITKSSVNRQGARASTPIVTTYTYIKDGCGCITSSTETVGSTVFTRKYLYEFLE